MLTINEADKKTNTWIVRDWPHIRRSLITTIIVNLFIGAYIVFTIYQNQKIIIFRLDQLEANQEAINAEILNLYKHDKEILSK